MLLLLNITKQTCVVFVCVIKTHFVKLSQTCPVLLIALKKQRYHVLFERLPKFSCVLLLHSCRMLLKKMMLNSPQLHDPFCHKEYCFLSFIFADSVFANREN